jgi:hypothetical protein
MSRRVVLPGADELFRATGTGGPEAAAVDLVAPRAVAVPSSSVGPTLAPAPSPAGELATDSAGGGSRSRGGVRHTSRSRARANGPRTPSGRERHDEKITVYLSPDELVDLEHARLDLRREHGLAVDRGRIVREALALVLSDLEKAGDASDLVRRLRDG